MARKTAIDRAIAALYDKARVLRDIKYAAAVAADAKIEGITEAIDQLEKQRSAKRTRKPKAVTPQTAA